MDLQRGLGQADWLYSEKKHYSNRHSVNQNLYSEMKTKS